MSCRVGQVKGGQIYGTDDGFWRKCSTMWPSGNDKKYLQRNDTVLNELQLSNLEFTLVILNKQWQSSEEICRT